MNTLDRVRLDEALTLARRSIGLSDPNPRVGCVIGHEDGSVLGTGFTQRAGDAHAEVMALRDARAQGHALRGATVWVTLEPCAHHGRTPPCCDALIEAGIARVVIAVGDPYPQVDGAGVGRMRAAGLTVEMADAELARAARALNVGFFSRIERGRPWVRLKIAASLDGRTALHNGASQWITGPAARADGHAWRKRAGAVLTGIGTALADDPRLDVRLVETVLQPMRVVVDSRLQLPASAALLQRPGLVRVYAAVDDGPRRSALESAGAVVVMRPGATDRVDLAAVLRDLADQGVNELHVEAGGRLNASMLRQGLVDELLVYLAPCLLGSGRDMAAFGPLVRLADGVGLRFTSADMVGTDLRLCALAAVE